MALITNKSPFKTVREMDAIRAAEARIQERLRRDFKPEPNHIRDLASFTIGRYDKGSFIGLFCVYKIETSDAKGNPLKKPLREKVIEGVDIDTAMSYLETAIRRRVFK